jgi:hypothetical protein
MKDEIIDIIWDFARSVAKTTLNPHITSAESIENNKILANRTANEIITIMNKHETESKSKSTAVVV